MTTIMPHTRDDSGGGNEPEGYEAWTKEDLQDELAKRDLPKTGNKPELIERLEQDDAA
jgi:hypothetical protein